MRRKSGSIILLLLMMPYLIESGHLGEGAERSKYFTLITLILNSHFLSWFLWSYESPIVHDYYKCNDINHEKFYKCQFVRDPASGATSSTSSFAQTCFLISAFKLIFDPGARFFWALKCHKKLLSNNLATLCCTKLVWSQNWLIIGSVQTENDEGQIWRADNKKVIKI